MTAIRHISRWHGLGTAHLVRAALQSDTCKLLLGSGLDMSSLSCRHDVPYR